MFAASDLMLLNKSDLLPYLEFDVAACMAAALRVNPHIQILLVSARTGEGLDASLRLAGRPGGGGGRLTAVPWR